MGIERLPGFGLNSSSNNDITHKRQPARAPTVLFRERCADVTMKMPGAPIPVWHYIDSARLNTGADF